MVTATEIKEKALAMGARAVGIASVEAINRFAPPGHRPADQLKGAQSVVVLGGGEPTAGAWRAGSNRVLGSIGYNRSQLASAARQLSYFIEDRYGYYAIPIPTGDWVGSLSLYELEGLCGNGRIGDPLHGRRDPLEPSIRPALLQRRYHHHAAAGRRPTGEARLPARLLCPSVGEEADDALSLFLPGLPFRGD